MSIRYVLPALVIVCMLTALVMIKTNKPVRTAEKSKQRDSAVITGRLSLRLTQPPDTLSSFPNQHVFLQQEDTTKSTQTTRIVKPAADLSAYRSETEKTATIVSKLKPGGLSAGSYQAISIPVGQQGYTLHINNDRITTIFLCDSALKKDSVN